jgi:uncharacterized protein YyaL (SSP411 family)
MPNSTRKVPNLLIHESSPYLLQHAYNPVQWHPFGKEAFDLAHRLNKPLLISIGYSACHWCHVMEHESFEDQVVASVMNEHFVNVKVDREERSDVDMLYMQAVQLMTGQGGWPLNCFVLPDGQAFYGGTYFKKDHWIRVLQNLSDVYKNDPEKVKQYANELSRGLLQSELLASQKQHQLQLGNDILAQTVGNWKRLMDFDEGGPNRAPKFPMPSNILFLLRYAHQQKDTSLMAYVNLTLTKMACGGIYDQLNGGFARYSTDVYWKVPHFEKMLYDNAQLAALYTEAALLLKNNFYKEIAEDILAFMEEHWWKDSAYFLSAFDADSDGEEGKFYVWNPLDLKDLLGEDFDVFARYFVVNERSYWENGNHVLMRDPDVWQIMHDFQLSESALAEKIRHCKNILKQETKSRLMPGLDDKCITAWNAMACSAYSASALACGNETHKQIALQNINFLFTKMRTESGGLKRAYKNGLAKIDAFLDDYAFTIKAALDVYVLSMDEAYLNQAKQLTEYCLRHFNNPDSPLLFYTDTNAESLAVRNTEVSDNVIPSSNAQMATNLFLLGHYFGREDWLTRAEEMVAVVLDNMVHYGAGYSHWACLALYHTRPFKQVAIVGKAVHDLFPQLYRHGLTNTMFALSNDATDLPMLKDRYVSAQTTIYVCEHNTCQLPVNTVEAALKQLA